MRVKEFCEDMYRREALKCYGYCPGERTFTDDWSFWHGFDVTADTKAYGKSDAMRRAKHGQGCGGSMEWIAVLRERRSRMNRRIAESRKLWQMKSKKSEQKPQMDYQCKLSPSDERSNTSNRTEPSKRCTETLQ